MPSLEDEDAGAGPDMSLWLSNRLEAERICLMSELEGWLQERLSRSHTGVVAELKGQALTNRAGMEVADPASEMQDVVDTGNVNLEVKLNNTWVAKGTGAKKGLHPPASPQVTQHSGDPEGDDAPPDDVGTVKANQRRAQSASKSSSDLVVQEQHSSRRTINDGEKTTLRRILDSPYFEGVSQAFILANTICMALQIQYNGFTVGYDLGVPSFYQSAEDTWPSADEAMVRADYFFNIIFTFELLFRLYVLRSSALKSPWIWFDTVIVVANLLEMLTFVDIDPSVLRSIRIVRVLRTLRLGRLAAAFEDLFLLVRSFQASLGALFWSFVLLFLVQMGVGMLINQAVQSYLRDGNADTDVRRAVFDYFGTFTLTIITMFEITFANWVVSCRVLMQISEWYGLFYLLYRCVLMFALLKVIAAVFIAETNRVVATDEKLVLMKKKKQREDYFRKLQKFFRDLDNDGDGQLSAEEFQSIKQNPRLVDMATALDIQVGDLDHLWFMLDQQGDNDGIIAIDEFLEGILKMKTPAVGIDVIEVLKVSHRIEKRLAEMTGGKKSHRRSSVNSIYSGSPFTAASGKLDFGLNALGP